MWYCSLWIDFLFPSAISKWVRWSFVFLQVEVNFHWQRSREIVQKVYENLLRWLCQITSVLCFSTISIQASSSSSNRCWKICNITHTCEEAQTFFCNEHRLCYSKALPLSSGAAAARWFTKINWQLLLKWFATGILVLASTDKWRTFHWETSVRLCWGDRQGGHPVSTNSVLLLVIHSLVWEQRNTMRSEDSIRL